MKWSGRVLAVVLLAGLVFVGGEGSVRAQVADFAIQEIFVSANRAFESGQFEECVRLCDNILVAAPSHEGALSLKKKASSAIARRDRNARYKALTSRQDGGRLRVEYKRLWNVRIVPGKTGDVELGDFEENDASSFLQDGASEFRLLWTYRKAINFMYWGVGGGALVVWSPVEPPGADEPESSYGSLGGVVRGLLGCTLVPFTKDYGLSLEVGTDLGAVFFEEWYRREHFLLQFFFNLALQVKGWNFIGGVGTDYKRAFFFTVGIEGF